MRRPVPGKARVHELAKEFGVDSKTVLATLKEQGEFVKSASSTVEAPVARRLRESFPSANADAPASGAAAPNGRAAADRASDSAAKPGAAKPGGPRPGPKPATRPAEPEAPAAPAP